MQVNVDVNMWTEFVTVETKITLQSNIYQGSIDYRIKDVSSGKIEKEGVFQKQFHDLNNTE